MSSSEELKSTVKQKYTEIVIRSNAGDALAGCGCGSGCGTDFMAENYTALEGYVPEADLTLGCGIPTNSAAINRGHTVLDLGSGAGNDVFVARTLVGDEGRVIGVDMTEAMIARANDNLRKSPYRNVEFRLGEIENLPVASRTVDVVLSNCVLNLVPDKTRAFAEIFRVLKEGAHFCLSDIVLEGQLPEKLSTPAALYTGCVSGAMQKSDYLRTIQEAGFERVEVSIEKPIELPNELLRSHLSDAEVLEFRQSGLRITSITVKGVKPSTRN